MELKQLLKQYWGFEEFRPLQEAIINSVLEGKDTLALMPTGGGKSICYQLPALAKPGICLVISPLIALMKDQAEALEQKGIRVLSVYSGMSYREVDLAFDNAKSGMFKFLFLSPERLENEIFRLRLPDMPVSLIAVDEAHCISEWGYDFRASYMKIAEIREILPKVPVLALTATATGDVKKDIVEKLLFKKGHQSFEMSFDRKNLIYAAVHEEDKRKRILQLLKDIPGSAIIYVRNRKLTKDIAEFLQRNQITADYYHGGLNSAERNSRQAKWKNNSSRVMVCTNAFGMGIDKADVRSVLHFDIPESMEAYYQEAGRAGRDGKRAFPIMLAQEGDKSELESRVLQNFPESSEIRTIYHAMGNFFQLPEGSGKGESFDFSLGEFCQRYSLHATTVLAALKFLEQSQYISLSEAIFIPSRFMVTADHTEFYRFQVDNPPYEALIKMLLRTYGGCFDNYVKIDEKLIAGKINASIQQVIQMMQHLKKMSMLDYQPRKDAPQLTWLEERVSREHLQLDDAYIRSRKKISEQKLANILEYTFSKGKCRGNMLLNYFGEATQADCGHCDYCLKEKAPVNQENIRLKIQEECLTLLANSAMKVEELIGKINIADKKEILQTLRWMAEQRLIHIGEDGFAKKV